MKKLLPVQLKTGAGAGGGAKGAPCVSDVNATRWDTVFGFPVFLTPMTLWSRADSSVAGKSATTGSSLPFGSRGLRPTFKVLMKKPEPLLPLLSLTFPPGPGDETVIAAAITQYDAKIDWFGTVRGRIGYLFGDGTVMTYVTGWDWPTAR